MALETKFLQVLISAPTVTPTISKQSIMFDHTINKGQVGVMLQGVGFRFKSASTAEYENHLVKTMKARITNVRIGEGNTVEFQVEFDFLDDSGNLGGGYVNVLAVAETN